MLFAGKIYQCANGHLVCGTCFRRTMSRCPTCRQPFGKYRYIQLISKVSFLEYIINFYILHRKGLLSIHCAILVFFKVLFLLFWNAGLTLLLIQTVNLSIRLDSYLLFNCLFLGAWLRSKSCQNCTCLALTLIPAAPRFSWKTSWPTTNPNVDFDSSTARKALATRRSRWTCSCATSKISTNPIARLTTLPSSQSSETWVENVFRSAVTTSKTRSALLHSNTSRYWAVLSTISSLALHNMSCDLSLLFY